MNSAVNSLQNQINQLNEQIKQNQTILDTEKDPDMKSLIEEEIKNLQFKINEYQTSIDAIEGNFTDTTDEDGNNSEINSNVAIIEIRAGTGGDEAGLFAYDLYNMYLRFAELKGWKLEKISINENSTGVIKTCIFKIIGKNAHALLQLESGVHRVQRVPKTESAGRIHTSTATVAVLPELKKIHIEIKPEDIKAEFFRSSGSGGQNVNKVSTAVRLTHLPTGIVAECQEERTQGKNREKALNILESRLYAIMKEQKVKELSQIRAGQVGNAERSEKIKTYNFPQDRLTDHRIGKNFHNLPSILNGNIQEILDITLKELNTTSSENEN